MQESFAAIQVTNNQVTNDNMLAISKDLQTGSAALVSTQQHVVLLLRTGATTPQLPVAWLTAVPPVAYATPLPTYMPPSHLTNAPPTYPPIPVTIYQQPYGQQQGGCRNS